MKFSEIPGCGVVPVDRLTASDVQGTAYGIAVAVDSAVA